MGVDILRVKYVNKFEFLKNTTVLVHRLPLRSYGRAAYMRYWKKRKCLEEDNFNNVPKQTKLNASIEGELVFSAKESILCFIL
jgi:hypothetical protein